VNTPDIVHVTASAEKLAALAKAKARYTALRKLLDAKLAEQNAAKPQDD
jgi:hypothetical protein